MFKSGNGNKKFDKYFVAQKLHYLENEHSVKSIQKLKKFFFFIHYKAFHLLSKYKPSTDKLPPNFAYFQSLT